MKKGIIFDKSKKIFPIIVMAIGIVLALALFIMRLNLVAVVNVAYMCIVVALFQKALSVELYRLRCFGSCNCALLRNLGRRRRLRRFFLRQGRLELGGKRSFCRRKGL